MQPLSSQSSMRWSGTLSEYGQPQVDPFTMQFSDYYYYTNTWSQWYYEILALQQILEFSTMGMGLAGDKNGDGKLEYEELAEYTRNMQSLSRSDENIVFGLKILMRKFWILADERGYLIEEDLQERLSTLLFRAISNVLLRPELADRLCEFVRSLVYSGVLGKIAIQALANRVKERMERNQVDPSIIYKIFIDAS